MFLAEGVDTAASLLACTIEVDRATTRRHDSPHSDKITSDAAYCLARASFPVMSVTLCPLFIVCFCSIY